jgi:hypothetical protein
MKLEAAVFAPSTKTAAFTSSHSFKRQILPHILFLLTVE